MAMAMEGQINLGPIDRIPLGEGREFEIAGIAIAVFRSRSGEVYASQAACPHRHAPLADGLLGGSELICPFHGWRFDLATGEPRSAGACAIRTYPVRVWNGEAIIDFDDAGN